MNEKPVKELIDDYVTGQIGPEEKIYLEELATNDAEVAAQLQSAKVAYDFLERSYYRNVKRKLQEYDRSFEMKDDWTSDKWTRLVAINVIMVAILWMISYWYYQPANLAKRFYHPLTEQFQSVDQSDTIAHLMRIADHAFRENDFVKAGTAFQLITAQSEDNDRYSAEWNFLLCQLAIHGITPEWRYRLDDMIDRSDSVVKGKAIELKLQLSSWIYRLTFLQISQELSSMKPRLI